MNALEALTELHRIMTTKPIPLPIKDNSVFIDATAFEKYTTCRRSFQYYFIQKRELGERRVPLEAGSIFHALVEHRRRNEENMSIKAIEHEQEQLAHLYYAGWKACSSDPAVANLVIHRHLEVLKTQDDEHHAILEALYPGFTPPLGEFRNESNMIDTLRAYNTQYPAEPFELLHDETGKPLVELPFAIPLVTVNAPAIHPSPLTFYWTGRIDLPTRWEDGIWNCDIKTGTRDNGFDEFANDQAQIGYLWALRRLLGTTPKGFMIDKVFWRPPTKTGRGLEFKRHKEPIDPDRIDEWEENTIRICEDICADSARGFFPMESKWCVGKYGSCPYLMVCKLPPKGRDVLLASTFYKDVTWSPLHQPIE